MKFNVITTPRRTYVKADSRDDYYYNYTTFSRRFFVIFFLNWASNFYPVPSGWAPDARPDASRPVSRAHVRRRIAGPTIMIDVSTAASNGTEPSVHTGCFPRRLRFTSRSSCDPSKTVSDRTFITVFFPIAYELSARYLVCGALYCAL